MKQCWEPETDDRPNFTELADKMGQYLQTSVKQVMLCAIAKMQSITMVFCHMSLSFLA